MGVSVSDDIGFFRRGFLDRIYRINRIWKKHWALFFRGVERAVLE
jgi:hypothetical protein